MVFPWTFKQTNTFLQLDDQACRHNELEDIPNLHVMMVLRSLASRHYLSEIYSWRWHYYTLTNEGIEYLREVLHLPQQVFPQTLTKQRPTRPALAGGEDEGRGKGKGKGKGAWNQDCLEFKDFVILSEQRIGEHYLHTQWFLSKIIQNSYSIHA